MTLSCPTPAKPSPSIACAYRVFPYQTQNLRRSSVAKLCSWLWKWNRLQLHPTPHLLSCLQLSIRFPSYHASSITLCFLLHYLQFLILLFLFFLKICLHNWWLVKAERDFRGTLLAVAGYPSRNRQDAKRVFVSAPIIKRHDLCTLETADGIYLILTGFINELHTKENGLPCEVFNHFLFGFPPDWESHVVNFFKEAATGIDSGNIITSNEEEPKIPVTYFRTTA